MQRPQRDVVLFVAALAFTLLTVLVVYQIRRTLMVNVGNLGDTPLVSGFYVDEPDVNYRYRWTTAHAEVSFDGAGSAPVTQVAVRAQGARPGASVSSPVTMSVSLNGKVLSPAVVTLTQQLDEYRFTMALPNGNAGLSAPYTVGMDTSTFQPPGGDTRKLGVKVSRVQVVQESSGLNSPPFWMVIWAVVLSAGLFGLFSWIHWPEASTTPFLAALVGAVLLGAGLLFNIPYSGVYMPPIAAAIALAGLVVWQRERLAAWPAAVGALARLRVASLVMLAALIIYAAFALWIIPQVDWIGHADYAENAVVARNLVEGRGFTVDYVAQFYQVHPGITHPAETWPLLQPVLIAPFFAIFGPLTWAAKLPNLIVMLVLAWCVFAAASRLWDSRVGLLAGLLVLVQPYFFNSVLYPINDLAFTAIFFGLAWLLWTQLAPLPVARDGQNRGDTPQDELSQARFGIWPALGIGALAGLLIWSKPSGGTLLVGLGVWTAWTWVRYHPAGSRLSSIPWRAIGIAACAGVLVLLPLVIRNLLAFGKPFFSTESFDAWILRYWDRHDWEDIYKDYLSGDVPNRSWVSGGRFGYENLVDATRVNFVWLWQKGVMTEPGQGDYIIGLVPLSGALLGLAALGRKAASLFGMVALSIGLYGLFVLLYWHFEGRYFQVAVPWLMMLLSWGIFWVWDRLRASAGATGKRWSLLLLPLAVALFAWPWLSAIGKQVESDTQPSGYVTSMQWLAASSSPSDVIMTRDPWELNWYTHRKAVMIPNDDPKTIESVQKLYGVTMLQLGGPVDGANTRACPADPKAPESSFPTGSRPALGRLYCGVESKGYSLVYRNGGLTVYRITR